MAGVVKAKYFPHDNFLHAKQGHRLAISDKTFKMLAGSKKGVAYGM
jgi:hypothetical protein